MISVRIFAGPHLQHPRQTLDLGVELAVQARP